LESFQRKSRKSASPRSALQVGNEIWIVHAFQKKSKQATRRSKHEIDLIQGRLTRFEEMLKMKKLDNREVVRGSGKVFRDLGRENADTLPLKAMLAAEIIQVLDRDGLSVGAAHTRTGLAAADFSRIRGEAWADFESGRGEKFDSLGSKTKKRQHPTLVIGYGHGGVFAQL
jgi:predicted XRE-type DNA-binding protein